MEKHRNVSNVHKRDVGKTETKMLITEHQEHKG